MICLLFPGYCPLIRLDRSDGRRSGGVAVYVSTSIAVKRRKDLKSCDFEFLWVELKIGSNNLICGICYRPPGDLNLHIRFLENLQRCLDNIAIQPYSFVTIIGDFNAHYDSTNPSESSDFGCLLYCWMECNNVFQVITEPTRITEHGATVLDLIITNCPGYFVHIGTLSPPSNCDHCFIFAKLSISFIKQKCYKRSVWDFSNVNEIELCNALATANLDGFLLNYNDINLIYEN